MRTAILFLVSSSLIAAADIRVVVWDQQQPGHEMYSVSKEKWPLRVIENAVRWLATELPKGN